MRRLCLYLLTLLVGAPTALGAQDIAIVGGRVMDLASGLDAVRNVLVTGDRIVAFFIPKDEMPMALQNPLVMITSDGVIVNGKGHPRAAGTFSRVLGRLVREEGRLTLMEALRKMTVMPAERLERSVPGMHHRDRLAPGAFADIIVFDPGTIIDRATDLNSAQYSEGVRYVLVNGTVVLDGGEFVRDAAPGRPVRHTERSETP